MVATKDD